MLLLERSGYPEETYHSFSYSPLYDADGSIGGMLCVVSEETERVIGDRRLETLRLLGTSLVGVTDQAQVRNAVCAVFAANRHDFPFVLMGLARDDKTEFVGCTDDAVPLGDRDWAKGALGTLDLCRLDLETDLSWPTGAWAVPPREALAVPIPGASEQSPIGTLIVHGALRSIAVRGGSVPTLQVPALSIITAEASYRQVRAAP